MALHCDPLHREHVVLQRMHRRGCLVDRLHERQRAGQDRRQPGAILHPRRWILVFHDQEGLRRIEREVLARGD